MDHLDRSRRSLIPTLVSPTRKSPVSGESSGTSPKSSSLLLTPSRFRSSRPATPTPDHQRSPNGINARVSAARRTLLCVKQSSPRKMRPQEGSPSRAVSADSPTRRNTAYNAGPGVYNEYLDILDEFVDRDLGLAERRARDLEKKTSSMGRQLEDLTAEKRELARRHKRYAALVDEIRQNVARLDRVAAQKASTVKQEMESKEQGLAERKKQVCERFEKRLAELRTQWETLVDGSVEDEETAANWRKKLDELNAVNVALETKLRQQRRTVQLKLEKMENELAIGSMEQSTEETQRLAELKTEVSDHRSKRRRLEKQVESERQRIEETRAKNASLSAKVAELGSFRGSMDERIARLKEQRSTNEVLLEKARAETHSLAARDFAGLRQQAERARDKLALERRRRLLLESEVDDYEHRSRVYVGCEDRSLKTQVAGVTWVAPDLDLLLAVVAAYSEGALQGISRSVVCANLGTQDYVGTLERHLREVVQEERYKEYELELDSEVHSAECEQFTVHMRKPGVDLEAVVKVQSVMVPDEMEAMQLPPDERTLTVIQLKPQDAQWVQPVVRFAQSIKSV